MGPGRNSAETVMQRERALAAMSFAFLLDETNAGVAGLGPLDALLVLAINQANIAPLTRDPNARLRYGQLAAPAPDAERRPVSINAVAASLGLPFETARRRIRRLVAQDICAISRAGVVVPASFLVSPIYLQSVLLGHQRVRRFYFDLKGAGLLDALPGSAYGLEDAVPVRAAARLIADYVLRANEGLMREAGNAISALVLVALLERALGSSEAQAQPLSVRALAAQLELPPETTRRHVVELEAAGLCARSGGGVVMPPGGLSRPGVRQLMADNAVHVQRLMAGLAERGVILAWENPEGFAARIRA